MIEAHTILDKKEQELLDGIPNRTLSDSWNTAIPKYIPRDSQIHVMDWINQLPAHVKYVMCEMPVGGGKSPLAIAFSAYINNGIGNSFILTPQKTLQRQYEESFEKEILASVYGRNNYTCEEKSEAGNPISCDLGADIKPKCEGCPADAAREKALMSPNMILNYSIALTYFKYLAHKIPPRDVMIFDECHQLESNLVEFSALNISKITCKKYSVKYKRPNDSNDAVSWIKDVYYPAVVEKLSEYRKHINELDSSFRKITKGDVKIIRAYKAASDHRSVLDDVLMTGKEYFDKKYVLVVDKDNFKIKELYGRNNFRNLCLTKANRFLFMSSTILDKEGFCRDLGIDPDEAAMISVDSEFNVENREVIYKPITKMNFGWHTDDRTKDRNKMMRYINHICNHHGEESGLIHTGSFQIAQWIVDNLDVPHEVLHHNPSKDKDNPGKSRDEVIDYYLENSQLRPTLLVSPSVTEGMDLKDDRGRFAIIAKVPYPFLGDAWIKRRMQLSKYWYNRQAITAIIQGCGRVVRSKDDWGQVYILDESFSYLYKQTVGMIPQWWKDGLVVM